MFTNNFLSNDFLVELEASAPKFVAELKDVSVKIGEEARFDVTIAANPEPDLKWYVTAGSHIIIFLRAYSPQAKVGSKAKRIKEQAKKSKNKQERKFSLSLGENWP